MINACPTERATDCIPVTIAWSATDADACSDPTFPDDAFCLQLVVLNGERHIYRLKRNNLAELFDRISELLRKSPVAPNKNEDVECAQRSAAYRSKTLEPPIQVSST